MRLANFKITNWDEIAKSQPARLTLTVCPPTIIGKIDDDRLLIRVGQTKNKQYDLAEVMAIAANSLEEAGEFEMFSVQRVQKFSPYRITLNPEELLS